MLNIGKGSNISVFFIGTAASFIATDLSLGTEVSWLPIANTLSFACIAPCSGYLQDIFGRRNTLILGSLVNVLGNGLIGGAHDFALAIVGATLPGIGNSIGELTAIAAIAELVPVNKRGMFLALNTGISLPFTSVVLYTQLLSTRVTWRCCFWISVIWNAVAFLALVATYFRLETIRPTHEKRVATLKSIDYVGMVLLIAGSALFIVALQSGGTVQPWKSTYILSQLVIGLGLLVALGLWEWKGAKKPVVPFRLFTGQRVVGFVFIIGFVAGIFYYTILNLGPNILAKVFEPSAVTIGLYGLPPTLCLTLGATTVNSLLTAFRGRARELLFISALMMTAFTGAQAVIVPDSPATVIVLSSLASLGVGGVLVPASTVVTMACPEDLIGTAVALVAAMRNIGGVIGNAIMNNILVSGQTTKIPAEIVARVVKAGLPQNSVRQFVALFISNSGQAAHFPGVNVGIMDAVKTGFSWGYADSVRPVFYASIPFGVLGAVLCLVLPNISKLMTNKVVVQTRR